MWVARVAWLGVAGVAGAQDTNGRDTLVTIRYKGLTLTPVGFVAAEGLFRSRNATSDMQTLFNSIPFSNTTNGKLTEFRGSARQSRLGLYITGAVGGIKLSGFFDSDFEGVGTTSNSNESNSYALRLRQAWVEAQLASGFSFSAGQMWTLLTTNLQHIQIPLGDIPPTIDAEHVGYDWLRQWAMRITQPVAQQHLWLALAAEEPQMTFAGHGLPTQVFIGNPGGSQLNQLATYSTDIAPDVIAKVAVEPGFGHYEIKMLGRLFRDRVVDPNCTLSPRCSFTATRTAGAVGAAIWLPFTAEGREVLGVGVEGLWGTGIGRYGTAQLPDATARPDGTIVPIRAAHGLMALIGHPTRQLDIYIYAGTEYAYREAYTNAAGKPVGYGSPLFSNTNCEKEFTPTGPFAAGAPPAGTCTGDTRDLYEGTIGFWYSFYRGPAGRIAWALEYHYVSKNTWVGIGGQPQAIDNMVFTSVRYYFP